MSEPHDPANQPQPTARAAPRLSPDSELGALFPALAAAIDSGLIVINTDCVVCYLNRRAEEIFHVASRQVCGQSLINLVRDYQVDAMVREVLGDGEARETSMQPLSSGLTLRVRCMPLLIDEALNGVLMLVQDMTHISLLERSRRDLVANVSHELRTPLTSLKLLVETLQSEPPPPVTRRMLTQMAHEVDAVTQLSEELHELSQIESGRVTMQFAPASIGPVIERALSRIRPQADRKQVQIVANIVDNRMAVLIDNKRMDQVLLNLLHNAAKFTNHGGRITVQTQTLSVDEDGTCHMINGSSGPHTERPASQPTPVVRTVHGLSTRLPRSHPPGIWMLVSITDTGIGIPADELPRIFERFYKVDRSRNRDMGGTGLGLAIAKHLIEGHGGRLWADSQERRGSTFYFTLPIA